MLQILLDPDSLLMWLCNLGLRDLRAFAVCLLNKPHQWNTSLIYTTAIFETFIQRIQFQFFLIERRRCCRANLNVPNTTERATDGIPEFKNEAHFFANKMEHWLATAVRLNQTFWFSLTLRRRSDLMYSDSRCMWNICHGKSASTVWVSVFMVPPGGWGGIWARSDSPTNWNKSSSTSRIEILIIRCSVTPL